ncbi:MAG: peptidoglycan-binding protein [Methanobrevibacter sp.]|jgi:hypothetical protein|nr:peptidoglycan-binding protein [Methanobrevibacter sp.]
MNMIDEFIGESENDKHEVYIEDLKLEGDFKPLAFIPFNTGVETENTINTTIGELTTGKEYSKYLNEKSQKLSFKTILTNQMAKDGGYEDTLLAIVEKAKETAVNVRINDKTFMGKVREFSISFPAKKYREYTWLIVEDAEFIVKDKTFKTFNYKKATTATKKTTKKKLPASLELLLKCSPVYNCKKFRVKCVTAWQKRMTADGFYGVKGYRIDGQFCTYTRLETKRWQKKYKIKQTGKFDKATKDVLKKRFSK